MFLAVTGRINMKYRLDNDEDEISFSPGELLRVPRGVEHLPVAVPGTEIVLFERADLLNTGNIENERTATPASI